MPTLNTTPTNLIETKAPSCTPFLQIKGLSKVYPTPKGPYPVLNDVNLTVCEGEFICVIGHSGCGKSTLLNMVSGFNQPTEGEVLLEDNPIVEPGPDRMVVFQNYALLPWKTAYENIYLGVNTVYPSLPEAEKKQIAQSYLDLVGLTEAANKRPTELSGGMKQRVSIARALALHPKVLILDEPFGALDPITREELQDELLKIWRDRQVTVLMITHDIDEALYLADRLVMMTNGPSATIGEILEIPFARPRDRARVMEDPRYYELRNEALDFLYHRFAHTEDDEVSPMSTPTLKTPPPTSSVPAKKTTYPLGAKVAAGVGLALAVAGAILGGYNAVTGKINPPEEETAEVVETPETAAPTPTAVQTAEAEDKTTTSVATTTPETPTTASTTTLETAEATTASTTSTPTVTPETADEKPETPTTGAMETAMATPETPTTAATETATATPETPTTAATETATATPETPTTAATQTAETAAAQPETAAEITDPAQLEDLKWELYDFLDNEWQTTPTYAEDLTYAVKVAEDGTIASYEPLNAAAKEFVKDIPLSEVKNTPVEKAAEFKVIFSPTGILDVQLAD